jgi:hypothetical protein
MPDPLDADTVVAAALDRLMRRAQQVGWPYAVTWLYPSVATNGAPPAAFDREAVSALALAYAHVVEPTGRRRPYKPDQKRVDAGDYVRASGLAICDGCGFPYFDHPPVVGFEWLQRACDGRLLKL